jgi:hypothetical protein
LIKRCIPTIRQRIEFAEKRYVVVATGVANGNSGDALSGKHEADEARRTEFVWFVFCMIGVGLVEG